MMWIDNQDTFAIHVMKYCELGKTDIFYHYCTGGLVALKDNCATCKLQYLASFTSLGWRVTERTGYDSDD